MDLNIYTLEKVNVAFGPFLALSVKNGPSVSVGTNIPWNRKNVSCWLKIPELKELQNSIALKFKNLGIKNRRFKIMTK